MKRTRSFVGRVSFVMLLVLLVVAICALMAGPVLATPSIPVDNGDMATVTQRDGPSPATNTVLNVVAWAALLAVATYYVHESDANERKMLKRSLLNNDARGAPTTRMNGKITTWCGTFAQSVADNLRNGWRRLQAARWEGGFLAAT